jgi:hypothetical protein
MPSTIAINVKELSVLIQDSVAEAEAILQVLHDLEECLSTAHEIISREVTLVSSDTSLGCGCNWPGTNVSGYENQLAVSKNVDEYWQHAMHHTLLIIQTLERIGENLEALEAEMATSESEEVTWRG